MKNNSLKEISITAVLVVLALFVLNPFDFWMPTMAHMIMLALLLVAFAVFAVFLYREKPGDERDVLHTMNSGRVAFLVGSALLTLGIVVQALQDSVDPWLVATLVGMVLSKLLSRIYSDKKQ